MLLSLYLAVLDDQSKEEQFIDVYNIYKRLVYHTAYKIMGDSYLAEDVLQEVFLYVAKNFSKIHRENCHELAAYLVTQMPAVLQTANTPITLFSNAALSLRPAFIGTGSTAIFSWKTVLVAVGKLSAAHRADL
mgnify:FL=1